jgi:hypothetical protein
MSLARSRSRATTPKSALQKLSSKLCRKFPGPTAWRERDAIRDLADTLEASLIVIQRAPHTSFARATRDLLSLYLSEREKLYKINTQE